MAFSMHICGPKMIAGNETIADVFAAQLDSNVGLFGIDCSVGVEYGYPRLKTDVFAIAAALQLRDLGPGDVVMVTDYGSYEAQTVLLAGLLVGTTVAALDYTLKRETLASLVDRSKPDVVFCGAPDAVAAMSDALETIAHRPTLKISLAGRDGFAAYSDVVATAGGPFARPAKSAAASKYRPPCAIIYSSGTTGVPKGIHLSDHALKSALMSFKRLMEEPDENRFMTTSPAFWYTGMLLLLLGVHYGKPRLFFSARPTAQRILSSIHQYKPTFLMTGVAAINEMMYCQMADGDRRHDIDSLATVVVGGSPMRPDLQRTITERLLRGRIPIKQGYGATEQGIIATWTTESDVRTVVDGCVGRPAPGVKIKVVSLETGECAGPDADGEIRVKSVSDMIGYVCDVKATVNSYDEDGWFKTGDVGHYTDDGRLFVVGRIKELMVYNGLRIAPTDVETVLLSHRAVLDAGVTSRDGPHGDLLVGVVRVKPDGGHVEADQLVAYVKSKVKDHEQLRGGVIFVDDVPRSPAGKLKRDELKRLVKK